jgi:hypothetical protein
MPKAPCIACSTRESDRIIRVRLGFESQPSTAQDVLVRFPAEEKIIGRGTGEPVTRKSVIRSDTADGGWLVLKSGSAAISVAAKPAESGCAGSTTASCSEASTGGFRLDRLDD